MALAAALAVAGCGDRAATDRGGGAGPPARSAGPVAAVILDAGGAVRGRVRLAGRIDQAAPDGRGGWFVSIAGPGGSGYRLAHVDAGGGVAPGWRPGLGPHGPDDTYAHLAAGAGRVYVAGNFAGIDGLPRSSLGAVATAGGGVVRSWPRARVHLPGAPAAIVVAGERVIVAAGQRIVALDARTGRPAAAFHASTGPDATEGPGVRALAVAGRWVYVGGRFTRVDGIPRVGLARIDPRTGAVDRAWRAPPPDTRPCGGCDGDVTGLATGASSASPIFVVGGFSALGGRRTPGGLGAVSRAAGAVTAFRSPRLAKAAGGDAGGYASVAIVGRRVFAAGDFGDAGGVRAGGFVVLDAASGRPLRSWHPATGGSVSVLAASGGEVLAGGNGLA